jgi:hypothetical protein
VVYGSETFKTLFISALLFLISTWHRVAFGKVTYMYNGAQYLSPGPVVADEIETYMYKRAP